jgi:5-(carboxyamino)imidazole ribonucleotide mutase
MANETNPLVAVIMGSKSDWETMRHADEVLTQFGVAHECRIVSAHRTPAWLGEFAASAAGRGVQVIVAGAGGAAHLPGMVAAQTTLPVLGVPVDSAALKGLDSLLSIVQMPSGVPVGTLAIGKAGATNAALLAIAILALTRPELQEALGKYREQQTARVRQDEAALFGAQPPPLDSKAQPICSFCGKSNERRMMVEGPSNVFICPNCIALASQIVQDLKEEQNL